MASGQEHLQNEATEPSETRQDRTQRFQNHLASLPENTEVVTSLSSFYNINNFIAVHAACGNLYRDNLSGRTDHDDDDHYDCNSNPNYGFSDLPSQGHGSYNSGPSDDVRLNGSLDFSQLDAGDGMGCTGAGRRCTGAELCTSGRYNHRPSSLPEGAEYSMTGEPKEQTALKTIAPLRLPEEHEETQPHPASNCGEYPPLQTNSSGYITEAMSTANLRDQRNRFLPILEAFFETNRKENSQTTGQQGEDVDETPSTVAPADESPAHHSSHTPASALAVVAAAGRNRDEEEDEEDGEVARGDEDLGEDEVVVTDEE
ncbi:uncharacterized protein [Haliotis asinina]|uniref:uncharacterized protein n=1 Tax=Haliotis asinina TaxID=109174 RepID=UPI003531B7A2